MGRICSVSEVAFWVEDVEASLAFYRDTLGFELEDHSPGQHAFLRSGDFLLVLFNPRDPGTKLGREYLERTGGPRGGVYHVAFKADRDDLEALVSAVAEKGFEVKGPVDFEGGRRSFFFEDRDQHLIELTDR